MTSEDFVQFWTPLHPQNPHLEIVQSLSGNLSVFTEKFLQKVGIYWVKNALLCAEMFLMMGIYSKKQSC